MITGWLSTVALGAALAAAPSPYPIVPTSSARLAGTFLMHGRITVAVGVRGEQPGETITRTWAFAPQACEAVVCQTVVLNRQRSASTHSTVTLQLGANGIYSGQGTFDAPLRCLGRTYPRGETAFYTVSVRITGAYVVNGIPYAATIIASYFNGRRTDHTRCPLGVSQDAASYTGVIEPAV